MTRSSEPQKFEFHLPGRIVFGRGEFDRLAALAQDLGKRALLIRGGAHLERSGILTRLSAALHAAGVKVVSFVVTGEPDIDAVEAGLRRAREETCDCVIGLGGGSVLDAAKAVAGLITQGGELLDYLEVVGRGRPIDRPAAPLLAIPTTAGTGTEVTRNAVIACPAKRFKASMRSPHLVPRVALIDPSLTDSLPPSVTASTGLDALTQLIESYVSVRAQPLTDGIAFNGLRRIARSFRRACADGSDQAARDDMALAALMSGICLANAGLGAVHGLAAPLGASFPVPHGVACAALLPHVMRANIAALREREPHRPARWRYAEIGRILADRSSGDDEEDRAAGVATVASWVKDVGIPGLSRFGLTTGDTADIAARARSASSMKGNPIVLTEDELRVCLSRAM